MNGITEKFSIFDYFNLLIGGLVFLLGIGVCEYPNSICFMVAWAATIEKSTFLLIISIVILITVSFVLGAIINEISRWFFKTRLELEKRTIGKCLSDPAVVDNSEKLERYRRKAIVHFFSKKQDKDTYSEKECSDYFAHCVYYIQVRNQDKKTERLREVQGLSMLLSCVFALIPLISLAIAAITHTVCDNACVKLWIHPIFLIFAVVFGFKYNRDMHNRVRMVLAAYDACTDMEKHTAKPYRDEISSGI